MKRVETLAARFGGPLARAALGLDALRVRASAKLPHADHWWLAEDALEQGTAWSVAHQRATTWPRENGERLTDLTAGLGFDALAAAHAGWQVRAVERDPLRAALLRANVAALKLESSVEVIEADLADVPPDGGHAFLDPDRRPGGQRTRDPEAFQPPASSWGAIVEGYTSACVKAPPHGPDANPDRVPETLVSLRGTLRERRLHYGTWPERARRAALLLPSGRGIEGDGAALPPAVAALEPGGIFVDPDASVLAAGLLGDLALREGLRPVHASEPYLVGTSAGAVPGHAFHLDAVLRPRPAPLQAWLDDHAIGTLELRARTAERPVAWWRKRLRTRGPHRGVLAFTKGPRGRSVVLAGLPRPPA